MRNPALTAIALLVAAVCLTGCGYNVKMSVISNRSIDFEELSQSSSPTKVLGVAEGRDSQVWFLIFPFGGSPNLDQALDRALADGDGDCLLRAKATYSFWGIPLLLCGRSWTVEGEAMKTIDTVKVIDGD